MIDLNTCVISIQLKPSSMPRCTLNVMKMSIVYMLALFAFMFSIPTYGQQTWKLKKDENGIKVYTRKSESSGFPNIKVETDLNGSVNQLRTILMNVENYSEWVYATKVSKLVKTITTNELISYFEVDLPWPASNRDNYSKAEINMSTFGDTLNMTTQALPDYGKREKNLVRIPYSKANWTVTSRTSDSVHLVYILQTDPGGNLPSWLVNLFSTKGPYSTFINLIEKMNQLN